MCMQILVAGSEVTLEYKVQVFTPPYLLSDKPRPLITSAPESITWHQYYLVQWSDAPLIDRVVLQKLSDNTHSLSFDMRQVSLFMTSLLRECPALYFFHPCPYLALNSEI